MGQNPWQVKAELLCLGLYITEEQTKQLRAVNPFLFEKGFINAVHMFFENVLINVCVAEAFCKKSPYSLCQIHHQWYLIRDGVLLNEVVFLTMPEWVFIRQDGMMVGSVVRPHSNACLSVWPSLDCKYIREKKGCKFCSLTSVDPGRMTRLRPDMVARLVKVALDYDPAYQINLSGGTCGSPEGAIAYLSEICAAIIDACGQTVISVECAPPADSAYLKRLKEHGVTAVVMNLEIFDERLRKRICPGKGEISNRQYMQSLQEAVRFFGAGNVSSVLIVGIQPIQDVLTACRQLIDMGVAPTLMPFKPFDHTPMEHMHTTNCVEYMEISRKVTAYMAQKGLFVRETSGCAACGACSVESNLLAADIGEKI